MKGGFNVTRYEIVKETLAHRAGDKVPYAINFTREFMDLHGNALIETYADDRTKEIIQRGNLNIYDAVSLAIGNYMFFIDTPWWNWYAVPQEYSYFEAPPFLPKTIGYGSYDAFFEKARFIKENTDVYVLVLIYGSHFEKAYFARGIENFLADIAGEPEFAKRLLDYIIEKNMVMIDNIVNCPYIDGILLGSDWGSQKDLLMSPGSWRELIKQGEEREYRLIKSAGKDVFVHSCGNIYKILGDLVEIGLDALNPVQPECMDIFDIKQKYGDKLTFWGGISTQQTLPNGTPDEVFSESSDIIRQMSVNGGYITCGSQEIQTDVPIENVHALIKAAKAFG
jgi:hypothetical protein